MTAQRLVFIFLCAAFLIAVAAGGFRAVAATQAIQVPNAKELRFQLIGNEPIAGPDGHALVKDWSVLMFKDRKTGECYLVFSRGSDVSAANVAPCTR